MFLQTFWCKNNFKMSIPGKVIAENMYFYADK